MVPWVSTHFHTVIQQRMAHHRTPAASTKEEQEAHHERFKRTESPLISAYWPYDTYEESLHGGWTQWNNHSNPVTLSVPLSPDVVEALHIMGMRPRPLPHPVQEEYTPPQPVVRRVAAVGRGRRARRLGSLVDTFPRRPSWR